MNIADILGYIDSLKRQYGGLLSDIAENPKQGLLSAGDRLNQGAREWNRDMFSLMGGMSSVVPEVREQSLEGLLGVLPMPSGINAIRAFHGSPPAAYQGAHRPMRDAGGAARLHDLTASFPEDVYGPNALQYYGSGDPREREVLGLLGKLRGKPDAEVTIYRGVPKDAAKTINPGDWVTLSPSVAKDYGPNVVKMKVKASQVTSWPDSLLEFGYFP